jgi:transposase-like protein
VGEKRAMHRYSEELKQRIVEEIEGGSVSIREVARETGAGVGQVQKWLEEYGRYRPKC